MIDTDYALPLMIFQLDHYLELPWTYGASYYSLFIGYYALILC